MVSEGREAGEEGTGRIDGEGGGGAEEKKQVVIKKKRQKVVYQHGQKPHCLEFLMIVGDVIILKKI